MGGPGRDQPRRNLCSRLLVCMGDQRFIWAGLLGKLFKSHNSNKHYIGWILSCSRDPIKSIPPPTAQAKSVAFTTTATAFSAAELSARASTSSTAKSFPTACTSSEPSVASMAATYAAAKSATAAFTSSEASTACNGVPSHKSSKINIGQEIMTQEDLIIINSRAETFNQSC
ncbi:hypothetical protein AXF42_Ash021198 [Apostasia shenzhenica]|uniref:Uncharacterized protein n=1 Tax=Apostasia shenzhenica TaxID=1088818 RepID=A0A2I0AXC3_9ASPA|nr:hypothetical protein AXF42_Ash021198 [Apostasia shenzhenica]